MILHVCNLDKFIPPFIDLINQRFDMETHYFLIYGDRDSYQVKMYPNVEHHSFFCAIRKNWFEGAKNVLRFLSLAYSSKVIILHSLFNDNLVKILSFNPMLLDKCYWAIWGGDLYKQKFRKLGLINAFHELFRRIVIRRLGHFVSFVRGDYELAKEYYSARGQYHECFLYPSNLYKEIPGESLCRHNLSTVNIQVGNSADPRNSHLEVLESLQFLKNENVRIFVPLSYGDRKHAENVIACGKQIFGDKFVALTKFMKLEEYIEFLGDIDIAIFNHKRQQGMGNIITLLGLGKKVFLRRDVTTWDALKNFGLHIYDTNDMSDLLGLDETAFVKNRKIIKEMFSLEKLLEQWKAIFAA